MFFLLHSGRYFITNPKNRKSIIAVVDFTPWEQLNTKDKDKLKFLSTFLHGLNEFINLVAFSNHSWGGKIWGIEMPLVPFKQNQYLMEKLNFLSFASLCHGEKPSPTSCSPHLTFKTNGFFKPSPSC
ncbi:hypothetical protein VP01_3657g1 [Puccinia sorghi]|uniref:Uncharacterized protein n=1 Tax=Puccinia sorghi TaxID=27349 RepID=A0A0L6UWD5_9BASI|nr:hypothetical protein VP01_3657g1 [Puccinia sorghi]